MYASSFLHDVTNELNTVPIILMFSNTDEVQPQRCVFCVFV